jgi:fumarate reductase flavoprotein subunit
MNKKFIVFMLVIALTASLFVGCTPKQEDKKSDEIKTDVLVIGGGGAGLISAITAAENGAEVILVEKMAGLGGNTITSATGLTASDTNLHKEANRPFTVQDHIDRTMNEAKTDKPEENLVKVLAENSNDAYEWLLSIGLKYKLHAKDDFWIIPEEGHFGAQLVKAYRDEAQKHVDSKKLEIKLNTEATELIVEDNKVVGAKVKAKDGKVTTIKAENVIMATGGFGNAPDLIGQYNERFVGAHSVMSTTGPTGDGFRMATAIGADVRDMKHHQMRPFATTGYWIRYGVVNTEGIGGIVVNKDAERFVAETKGAFDLVEAILKQKDRVGYLIFDAEAAELADGKAALKNAEAEFKIADTIEELAQKLGLNADALKATIEAYNNGDDAFERTVMGKVTEGPFYGVEVKPASHFTMAGIAINESAQVLNKDGKVIEGLFAVGEVTGGLYGSGRVAGNNTTENIVFGRIAGKKAAGK